MTADDVALNWNPLALLSRGIVVKGLGAQRITIAIRASDSATPLPPTLALPTDVAIDRVAVAEARLDVGTNSGTHHGIDVRLCRRPIAHRVERLSLVLPTRHDHRRRGDRRSPPFAVERRLRIRRRCPAEAGARGHRALRNARGRRARRHGRAGDARVRAAGAADAVRGRRARPARPSMRRCRPRRVGSQRCRRRGSSVKAEGRPAGGGLAGRRGGQRDRGPDRQERLPVRSIAARFAWRAERGRARRSRCGTRAAARVTGSAQVPLDGGAGKWTLDVHDVDLKAALLDARHDTSVRHARRRSRDGAPADRRARRGPWHRRRHRGVVCRNARRRRLSVERFQIRAGGGELAGSGAIELAGRRTFDVTAKAKRSIHRDLANFLPASSAAISPRTARSIHVARDRQGGDRHRQQLAGVPFVGPTPRGV